MALDYRILGPFEVMADGQRLRLGGVKQRALLAALVLRPDQVVSVDSLIDMLWGANPPTSAAGIVRTYASRLRRVLWPEGGAMLHSKRPGYVLEIEPSQVDANRFEQLVRQARRQLDAGSTGEAWSALTRAHELWLGDALADLAWIESLRPTIARLEQMRLMATELRVEAGLQLGRHADLVAELTELTAHHPVHERFWSQLIVALYRTGRQAEALDAYQSMRSTFVEQMGIDPSPELRALELQVLNQSEDLTWRAPAPATTSPPPETEWPRQIGRPPTPARAFQPRATLEAGLGCPVGEDGGTALDDAVIVGDGGVGKTQLAVAAFASARADGVNLLVWANATSRESIVATFAQARAAIGPRAVSDRSATKAAGDFLSWLAVTPRSWLVVLDDVAKPADLQGLWPEGRSGRVLATTRRRDLAPAASRQVPVDVFTPQEARGYLEERLAGLPAQAPHPDALAEADGLANDVGRLPVALAQAASVILNEGITCAAYRQRFSDRSTDLERLFPDDAPADEYANSVSTTWALALERADQIPPVGLARHILRIAAVVDGDGAPEELWTTRAVLRFLDDEVGGRTGASAREVQTVLRNLHRLNLVTHEPGGECPAVRTHTLVQRATLDPLGTAYRARLVRVAADALTEIWPRAVSGTELTQALLRNAAALVAVDEVSLWAGSAHEVLFRAGDTLGQLGRTDDAIGYWTDMTATAAWRLGPDHPDTLAFRWYLAERQGDAGDATGAAAALAELARDCAQVLGVDHPNSLTTRHSVAAWPGATGDVVGSWHALQSLVKDRTRVLGPDHPITLATRSHQADWQGAAGDVTGAVAALEVLAEDVRRVFGPRHTETLARRAHLADWRAAGGDAAGAADLFGELVHDCLHALGPDHELTLAARHGHATMLGASGGPRAAVDSLVGLAEDRSLVMGRDHPLTLATRYSLAFWRGVAGDLHGAEQGLGDIIRDRSRVLGMAHPDTLTTRHALVWCRGAADTSAAVEMLEELLDDSLTMLGPDHRHTLATRNHLAFWRGAVGDVAGAATALEELLDDSVSQLGPDHRSTLTTRLHLAHWWGAQGRGADATRALAALVEDCVRIFGPDHPDTFVARIELATWEGVTGDPQAAVEALQALFEHSARVFGPDHPDTVSARHRHDEWDRAVRDGRRAVDALREAWLHGVPEGNPHMFAKRIGLGDWRLGRRWETQWDHRAGPARAQAVPGQATER